MPNFEFTDIEREFMTTVDGLIDAGDPEQGPMGRIGEEGIAFMPTTKLALCANVIIGFASRPIGGADMGFYEEGGISAYSVSAHARLANTSTHIAHLFHLRDGVIWHREQMRPGGRGMTIWEYERPTDVGPFGHPLPAEIKEDFISWLSSSVPDIGNLR